MSSVISNTIQAHIAAFDEQKGVYKHLLLKRAPDADLYPGLWQVVTGRIEIGETAIQTALREVKEETGLHIIDAWTLPYLASFFNSLNDTVSFAPVFAFLVDFHQDVIISNEHEKFEWLNLNEAIERVVLPTHKEGLRIFNTFILSSDNKALYRLKI